MEDNYIIDKLITQLAEFKVKLNMSEFSDYDASFIIKADVGALSEKLEREGILAPPSSPNQPKATLKCPKCRHDINVTLH